MPRKRTADSWRQELKAGRKAVERAFRRQGLKPLIPHRGAVDFTNAQGQVRLTMGKLLEVVHERVNIEREEEQLGPPYESVDSIFPAVLDRLARAVGDRRDDPDAFAAIDLDVDGDEWQYIMTGKTMAALYST